MSVSVVIPAYNAEAFLHVALDSVLRQTVPVDQVLVIDDGSTDRTPQIAEAYGGPVRLLRQKNQGPSAARNLGVAHSSSDWIAFLDADDAWEPEKIERQLAALAAAPAAVLCYTGLLNLHKDGLARPSAVAVAERLPATLRICNPGITPSCVMLSRKAFLQTGGFTNKLKGSEDWDMWLRLIDLGPFCAVDEPLTRYQVSNTGLSSNAAWMLGEARSMLEDRLLRELTGLRRVLWRRRILSYQLFTAGLTARAAVEPAGECSYLIRSVVQWPSPFWYPRRFLALAVSLRNRLRMSRRS